MIRYYLDYGITYQGDLCIAKFWEAKWTVFFYFNSRQKREVSIALSFCILFPCFGEKSEENETILRTETSGHCKSKGE